MDAFRLTDYLRSIPLFSHLSAANLLLLADVFTLAEYPAGATLTRQADLGSTFFVIVEGTAVVRRVDESGRQRTLEGDAGLLRPGQWYGMTSLFLGEPRDATVTATTLLRVWILRRADFEVLWNDVPDLRRQIRPMIPEEIRIKLAARRYAWLEPGEFVLMSSCRHWVVFSAKIVFPTLLTLAYITLLLVLRTWLGPQDGPRLGFVIPGLVILAIIVLWHLVDWRNDYVAVTTRRIIHLEQVAFVYTSRSESPLDRVQNINVITSLWGRMLGYGDLAVALATQAGAILFDHAPDPDRMRDVIWAEIDRAKATRRAVQRQRIRETLAEHAEIDLGEMGLDLDGPDRPPVDFEPDQRQPAYRLGALSRGLLWLTQQGLLPSSRIETALEVTWRKHWLFLFGDIFFPFVLSFATVFLTVFGFFGWPAFLTETMPLYPFIMLVAMIVCWGWLWWVYTDWSNDLYTVTGERIIDIEKRPFSTEKRREARLGEIQNIHLVIPGFWASTLHYGSVVVQTAGAGEFTFDHVPDPHDVQNVIFQKMQAFRDAQAEREAAQQRNELAEWFSVYEEVRERRELLNGAAGDGLAPDQSSEEPRRVKP